MIFDVLLDTFIDCLKMLPFLFAAYFLIEYVERSRSLKLEHILSRSGRFGFIPGAFLGLIPQCGFSGMAANLYSGNVITMGTLAAVFISTSDEAVPLLVAMPEKWPVLLMLLGLKLAAAMIAGFLCDFVIRKLIPEKLLGGYRGLISDVDCHDHDEKESLLTAKLRHTGIIFIWLFFILLIINLAAELIGAERLTAWIGGAGIFRILLSGLIGMIPNCASSVLLTQMYAAGQLPFSALFAGLCSGSGIGTLVLLKTEKNKRHAWSVLALIYLFGIAGGFILSVVGL